jgi:predicted nucleic acid-binding protein
MDLVIDANILFSALIKNGKTRELMLFDRLKLYSAEYLFEEFEKHFNEIKLKTNVDTIELKDILELLILESNITIITMQDIKPFKETAKKISPDPKDAFYFAVALKLNCAIWSNDKRLKNQKYVKVYSTSELIQILK